MLLPWPQALWFLQVGQLTTGESTITARVSHLWVVKTVGWDPYVQVVYVAHQPCPPPLRAQAQTSSYISWVVPPQGGGVAAAAPVLGCTLHSIVQQGISNGYTAARNQFRSLPMGLLTPLTLPLPFANPNPGTKNKNGSYLFWVVPQQVVLAAAVRGPGCTPHSTEHELLDCSSEHTAALTPQHPLTAAAGPVAGPAAAGRGHDRCCCCCNSRSCLVGSLLPTLLPLLHHSRETSQRCCCCCCHAAVLFVVPPAAARHPRYCSRQT